MVLMRVFAVSILVLHTCCVATGQELFRQRMFKDLTLSSVQTFSFGDSVYHFSLVSPKMDDYSVEEGKRYFWFNDGVVKSTVGGYSGKLFNGRFEKTGRDGSLLEKGRFINGLKEGKWIAWFENGLLSSKCYWRSGLRTGDFLFYHDNGVVFKKGKFRKDVVHGRVQVFDRNGNHVLTENYKHGRLVKSVRRSDLEDKSPEKINMKLWSKLRKKNSAKQLKSDNSIDQKVSKRAEKKKSARNRKAVEGSSKNPSGGE